MFRAADFEAFSETSKIMHWLFDVTTQNPKQNPVKIAKHMVAMKWF